MRAYGLRQCKKVLCMLLALAIFSLDCAWAQDALAPITRAGKVKQSDVQVVKVEPEVDKKEISEGVKEVVETGVKAGILITISSVLSGCADIITQHPVATILTMVGSVTLIFFASWRIFFPVSWYIWRLKSGNRYVRRNAAEALGKIGDARAVEPLIKTLEDKNLKVRRSAAWALGGIGDARAVKSLIKTLEDGDIDVLIYAAEALGKIGDARAVEPLIKVLGDKSNPVRRSAAEALGKIGEPAVEPLIKALEDKDGNVRFYAAETLGKIGDVRAVKPLIKTLRDENASVRDNVAEALGKIGDVRAVEPLIKTLRDETHPVHRGAAEALGKIGDAQALVPLRDLLARLARTSGATLEYWWPVSLGGFKESFPSPAYLAIQNAIRAIEERQHAGPTVPTKPTMSEPTAAQRELSELQAGHANEVAAGRQVVAAALEQAIQQTQARITAIDEANRQLANSQTSLQEKNATSTRLQGEIVELETRLAGQNKAYQDAEVAFKNAQATYTGIAETVNELKIGYEIEVRASRPIAAEEIRNVLDLREGQLRDAERFLAEKQKEARDAETQVKAVTSELQAKQAQLASLTQGIEALNAQIAQWDQIRFNLEAGGQLAQQALGAML